MSEHYHHHSDIAHVARILRRVLWCDRYMAVLEIVSDGVSPSSPTAVWAFPEGKFMEEAYDCGMIPSHYSSDIETILPWEEAGRPIMNPTPEFLAPLSSRQILACIAYHFRADHFCEGSLTEESIPSGSLLLLVREYRKKALAELASYDDDVISKALLCAFQKENPGNVH